MSAQDALDICGVHTRSAHRQSVFVGCTVCLHRVFVWNFACLHMLYLWNALGVCTGCIEYWLGILHACPGCVLYLEDAL